MVLGNDPDSVSVGSFYVNPVVSDAVSRTLPGDAPRFPIDTDRQPVVVPLGTEPDYPDFTSGPGDVKLSAAWLIEHAGIPKGFGLAGSDAAVSSKHTLAITNRGQATAADVLELARYISIRVHDTFGIILTPEPTMIGFD